MAQPQRVGLDEALATLQAMFNGIDREVLQVVLEANHGQMERTIDVLLKMSNENDPSTKVSSNTASVSSLPDDFLSIPGSKGSDLSQVQQDELYAKMVQDELFVQELASQAQAFPEFNTFLGETGPRNLYPEAARAARANPNGQQAHPQQQQNDTFKEIKEKFSSMSEAAKRKFSELATRFSRNPSRGNNNNTNTASNSNTRYTSLPATDEEVVAFESPDSPGTSASKRGAYTGDIEMTTDISSLSDKRQKKEPKITDNKKDQ